MTTTKMMGFRFGVLAIAVLLGMVQFAHAGEKTAFELIKEGDRYVGEQSKDKVVQIRSEKSIGSSLTPNVWFIVFYDPDATFKATEVKFGGGEKMDVKRPMRMLEMGNGDNKQLDPKKLKVDSDKALKIAKADPLLQELKLTASEMKLEQGDEGPVWKVRLWAAKTHDPSHEADIGQIQITSADGNVVKRDLHIERVN